MTKEQKKADALDAFVKHYKERIEDGNIVHVTIRFLIERYDAIESEKPLSKDLYADEVFVGNCGSRIRNTAWKLFCQTPRAREETMVMRNMRLSHMPHINDLAAESGISKKSLWVYETVMRENGFTEKLE